MSKTISHTQDENLFWQLIFGKRQTVLANNALNWQNSPYIFGKFHEQSLRQNVGEIEW